MLQTRRRNHYIPIYRFEFLYFLFSIKIKNEDHDFISAFKMMRRDERNSNDTRKIKWCGDDGELKKMRESTPSVLFADWKLESDLRVLLVLIIIPLVEHFGCSFLFFAHFSLLPYSSLHFIGFRPSFADFMLMMRWWCEGNYTCVRLNRLHIGNTWISGMIFKQVYNDCSQTKKRVLSSPHILHCWLRVFFLKLLLF